MNTSDLIPGQRVRLSALANDSDYCQQLQSIGLVAGTEVEVIRRAPLGDPIEIAFRGINLALRQSEADTLQWEIA